MVTWLGRRLEALFEARRIRIATRELARMDPAVLRDIGIEPGMIEAAARGLAQRQRQRPRRIDPALIPALRPAQHLAAGGRLAERLVGHFRRVPGDLRWTEPGGRGEPVCCG